MKTKKRQEFRSIFSTSRIWLSFAVIAIMCIFPLSIFASEGKNNILNENYNLTEEYSLLLSEESNIYTNADTDPQKSTSKKVVNIVNEYRKALLDLQSHPEAGERLLTKEISLLYAKGSSAGEISWIYYKNLSRLKGDSSLSVAEEKYNELREEIDAHTDSSALASSKERMRADMNRTVFTEIASSLAQSGDSVDSQSLILGTADKIKETDCTSLDGALYEEFITELEASLSLQRSRDALIQTVKDTFAAIYPNDDFLSNQNAVLFIYKIKNASSIAQMNSVAKDALYSFLDPLSQNEYTNIYINTLKKEIGVRIEAASAENKAAELLDIVADFSWKYAKSATKDSIAKILLSGVENNNEELIDVERKFNADGGIIDSCATEAELESERIRADFYNKIYTSTQESVETLSVILGSHTADSFEQRIKECRTAANEKLFSLDSSEQDFSESCSKILSLASSTAANILNEAKAERYLLDNKEIIQKPSEELTLEDEIGAKKGLEDFIALEGNVRASVLSQAKSIAEKYKTILVQKIQRLMVDDMLYLDLCENICDELVAFPLDYIDDFYNKSFLIFKKAEALKSIVEHYRGVLTTEIYADYSDREKDSLLDVCKTHTSKIADVSLKDQSLLEDELADIIISAKLSMRRTNELARIRIAARNSQSPSILSIISSAEVKIFNSFDQSQMISEADKAIFKINRHLTADEAELLCEELKYTVEQMAYLSAEQKQSYASRITTLKASTKESSLAAENITVLTFVWNSFSDSISSISASAEEQNLISSKDKHLAMMSQELKALEADIRGLSHLSDKRRDEILNSAMSLETKFKADIALAQSGDDVAAIYKNILDSLNSIAISASGENLANYKAVLKDQLLAYKESKQKYSEENYNKLLSIIESADERFMSCGSIGECNDSFEDITLEIENLPDLLDDAKADALTELSALYSDITSKPSLYSTQNLITLESLYLSAIDLINSYEKLSDIPAVKQTLSEKSALLLAIPKDRLYTSADAEKLTESDNLFYTPGYDFTAKGYLGTVYLQSGLSSSGSFSIFPISEAQNMKDIKKIINKAAKQNKIYSPSELSDETMKLLKKCSVGLGVDITLTGEVGADGLYTVVMLLPNDVLSSNIIGVAYIGENNSVEFYNAEQRGSLISFKTTHFSNFYIVTENTVNLAPIIITLIILLICELLVFAFLIFLRFQRKRKETPMLPMLSAFVFNPISPIALTKVQPQNGITLTVLLAVGVLTLGCAIAVLARTELAFTKKESKATPPSPAKRAKRAEEKALLPRTQKAPLLRSTPPRLTAKSEEDDIIFEREEDKVLCTVGANEENRCAESYSNEISIEEEYSYDLDGFDSSKIFKHKAEINLDIIEAHFSSDDVITPEELKRKRLIPKKTDHVKILARGTLSKPLTIEAHDFSRAAADMLKAVGGDAIRIR